MAAILVFWPVTFGCLLARLFSDFVLFISFLLSIRISGFLGAFFPIYIFFVLFSMRRAYTARRRRRRDVITHRRHRLSRNFTHRLFRALFSVYLHFESVGKKNSNPMRECRQKASKMRRCHRCGIFSMPIMRKLRD